MSNPESRGDDGTAREWVERLIGRSWKTTAIVGALENAERQADEARQQLEGAVNLTDAEWERVISWLATPVPPGPGRDFDVAIMRKIAAQRGT